MHPDRARRGLRPARSVTFRTRLVLASTVAVVIAVARGVERVVRRGTQHLVGGGGRLVDHGGAEGRRRGADRLHHGHPRAGDPARWGGGRRGRAAGHRGGAPGRARPRPAVLRHGRGGREPDARAGPAPAAQHHAAIRESSSTGARCRSRRSSTPRTSSPSSRCCSARSRWPVCCWRSGSAGSSPAPRSSRSTRSPTPWRTSPRRRTSRGGSTLEAPTSSAACAGPSTACSGRSSRPRRAQSQLVLDASHELRTPLTSLRTNLEVIRRVDELSRGGPVGAGRRRPRPAPGADRPGGATWPSWLGVTSTRSRPSRCGSTCS